MNTLQAAIARSLAAHRDEHPEARLALDRLTADLAEVTEVADDSIPAFMAAAAAGTTPEPRADRDLPQEMVDVLAAAEAALCGDSYDAEHDALRDLAEYLQDLYAVEVACARCGTPYEWGEADHPGLCRECADTEQGPEGSLPATHVPRDELTDRNDDG